MGQFIDKSLDAGLSVDKVKSEIHALCYKEMVVPSILLDWTKEEFEEKSLNHTERNPRSKENICATLRPHDHEQLLFNKDTLYHAGLCCEAISSCSTEHDIKVFFQTGSPMHSLEEISFSKNHHVKPYLIAKQGNTIYVAFQSEVHISKQKDKGYDAS